MVERLSQHAAMLQGLSVTKEDGREGVIQSPEGVFAFEAKNPSSWYC
jgi:hypothetical protein